MFEMNHGIARIENGPLMPGQAGAQASLGWTPLQRRFAMMLRAFVILCLTVFAWYPTEAAQRGDVGGAGIVAAGPAFAIGDFDGDAVPDLATVQPGLAEASPTSYWIHFDFSLGEHRSIAVSGPAGGLQIASRDVNGDSFLDLIISTRIANQPVAVLLNDGQGNFHLADARAFGAAIWETLREWRAGLGRGDDAAVMASAGWAGADCGAVRCAEPAPASGEVALASEKNDRFVLPHEVRGRAPPAA